MATNVDAQICVRRDTAANWTSANPTLLNGEVGYDTTNNKIKIGNGSSLWSALPYLTDATGTMTVNTQEFVYAATPVNWVKPAGALWTYVTMCGAGCDGSDYNPAYAGSAGMTAQKLFVSSLLPATVAVLPGLNMPFGSGTNVLASSFFGDPAGVVYLAAAGQYGGASDTDAGIDVTTINLSAPLRFGQGGGDDSTNFAAGNQGYAQGPGGGGVGGGAGYGANGGAGGRAGTNAFIANAAIQRGGGNAGGLVGTVGGNGASGGYDTVTGFGHGGGGGGEGTAGVGGNGGNAVRGGGGGGAGYGSTGLGLPGAGGTGYVRVTTICFN